MKKLFLHLSILCLLAALLVPMVGCGNREDTGEESPAATTMEDTGTATDTGLGTDMGTTGGMDTTGGMGTDMGTTGGTTEPMGTEMTPPPAQ
jgi:hypothetical protein